MPSARDVWRPASFTASARSCGRPGSTPISGGTQSSEVSSAGSRERGGRRPGDRVRTGTGLGDARLHGTEDPRFVNPPGCEPVHALDGPIRGNLRQPGAAVGARRGRENPHRSSSQRDQRRQGALTSTPGSVHPYLLGKNLDLLPRNLSLCARGFPRQHRSEEPLFHPDKGSCLHGVSSPFRSSIQNRYRRPEDYSIKTRVDRSQVLVNML